MKKYLLALAVVALALALAPRAEAAIFLGNQITGFDFKNWENLIDVDNEGSTAGKLDVGDRLRGTFQLQNTSYGLNGGVYQSYLQGNSAGNPELTGVFELEVIGKQSVGGGLYNYTYGPSASFAADLGLPTNTILALWTDPVFEFDTQINMSGNSVANVEAAVIDGNPFLALGFETSRLDPNFGTTPDGDGYWYSMLTNEDVPPPFGSAQFFYGLEVQEGWGMDPDLFVEIKNPLQIQASLVNDLNDFVGKGSVSANDDSNTNDKYDIGSNDPGGAYVVPEPASMVIWALLGLALIGCRGWTRRSA